MLLFNSEISYILVRDQTHNDVIKKFELLSTHITTIWYWYLHIKNCLIMGMDENNQVWNSIQNQIELAPQETC